MGAKKRQLPEGHVSGQANEPLSRPAHNVPFTQVAKELNTDLASGLNREEAAARLLKYGPNDLGEEKGVRRLEILIAQVVNAMTLVCPCPPPLSQGTQVTDRDTGRSSSSP